MNVHRQMHRLLLAGCLSFTAFSCTGVTTGGGDENILVSDALGFEGTLTGKVLDTQSTRSGFDSEAAGQSVPLAFDIDNTSVRFHDLAGNDLMDPSGNAMPAVPLNSDGTFDADGLPVGTDFILCVDIGNDGTCQEESYVNIPADDSGTSGSLDEAHVDPLTTMVLAKLKKMLDKRGIAPGELPFSPAAVVTRIVTTYRNLFEETGIEQTLTLDEILSLTRDEIAALFDSVIPQRVRDGIKIAEGNIEMRRAQNAASVALATAEVFLRAGFPIADMPGPPDLSALGELEGVRITSPAELFGSKDEFNDELLDILPDDILDEFANGLPEDLPDNFFDQLPDDVRSQLPGDLLPGPAAFDGPNETIYISEASEPDRNFAAAEGDGGPGGMDEGMPMLPMLNDFILMEMARLHLAGREITLGDLYDLLVSIDDGLGARLTYFVFDPNFHGPPLNVFETEDGRGRAIDLDDIFRRVFDEGFDKIDHTAFESRDRDFRNLIRELLAGTVSPTFERLLGPIVSEQLGSVEDLTDRLRHARAHLPFSLSGPSVFFVVGDGDSFDPNSTAAAVTVDADISPEGRVTNIVFNPSGNGKFYLGFTGDTEEFGKVELIVRETGRFVHSQRGPVRVSIFNNELFSAVNGVPFADMVSDNGNFYPGTHVTVVRSDFVPQPPPTVFEREPLGPDDGTAGTLDPDEPAVDDVTDLNEGTADDQLGNETEVLTDGTESNATSVGSDTQNPPQVAEFDEPARREEQIFVLAHGLGSQSEPVRVEYDRETGIATVNPFGRNLLMFREDSEQTGLFGLLNEQTGRPAASQDPDSFFAPPIERPEQFDEFFNEADDFEDFNGFDDVQGFVDEIFEDPMTEDDEFTLPPLDELFPPGEDFPTMDSLVDSLLEPVPAAFGGLTDEHGNILVNVEDVLGLSLERFSFNRVFGIEVANDRHNPDMDPYFDDINDNGTQDADEPTAPYRPTLFDPGDWRSTDIRLYYRRADNGGPITFDEVAFDSPTPQTLDGVELVARTYRPRLNAFRFGRPGTAVNLLTAFAPPDFFNGTRALNRDTVLDIFSAIAFVNLIMDQVFNIEAEIDIDGLGPQPRVRMLVDAHVFVMPIDDPFILLLKGFRERSRPSAE